MSERRILVLLVVAAAILGILVGAWLFGVLTAPPAALAGVLGA